METKHSCLVTSHILLAIFYSIWYSRPIFSWPINDAFKPFYTTQLHSTMVFLYLWYWLIGGILFNSTWRDSIQSDVTGLFPVGPVACSVHWRRSMRNTIVGLDGLPASGGYQLVFWLPADTLQHRSCEPVTSLFRLYYSLFIRVWSSGLPFVYLRQVERFTTATIYVSWTDSIH